MDESFQTHSAYEHQAYGGQSGYSAGEQGEADSGRTIIADIVYAKIAATAIAESQGIHLLLNSEGEPCGPAHTLSEDPACGLEVQNDEGLKMTVRLVVDYGVPIGEMADKLRSEIASRMRRMTGMPVREVNVHVTDIYFHQAEPAGEDEAAEGQASYGEGGSDRPASRYSGILTGGSYD